MKKKSAKAALHWRKTLPLRNISYEERYRERVMHNLTKRAHQLGLEITPTTATTA